MPAPNKIEKYRLHDRLLALSAEGKNTIQIADILTAELQDSGAREPSGDPASISKATVARYLKSEREERASQTRQLVHDHIKETVPTDLAALDEVEGFLLGVFRNAAFVEKLATVEDTIHQWAIQSEIPAEKEAVLVSALKPILSAGHDLKTRINCAMNACKIVETKLRFSGAFEDGGAGGQGHHPVDLDQFRTDLDELKEQVEGECHG